MGFFVSYFLAFFLFINRLWCGGCTGSTMVESLTTQAAFQLHFGPHMCLTEQIHFILINEAVSHSLVSLALYVHKRNISIFFLFYTQLLQWLWVGFSVLPKWGWPTLNNTQCNSLTNNVVMNMYCVISEGESRHKARCKEVYNSLILMLALRMPYLWVLQNQCRIWNVSQCEMLFQKGCGATIFPFWMSITISEGFEPGLHCQDQQCARGDKQCDVHVLPLSEVLRISAGYQYSLSLH